MTATRLEDTLTFSHPSVTPTFANPILSRDFPDPFILRAGKVYYAYATNARGTDLPVRRSADLVHWEDVGEGMGPLPRWARRGHTWAPDIMAVAGGYVLYYTARHKKSGQQVIGAGFSVSPEGPFLDSSKRPLIAQHDLGGAIDAHAFIDADGKRYLYWKNDGNSRKQSTHLWVQQLSEDGLTLLGEARRLLRNDRPWERHLIEAPFMHAHEGRYYLFYSAAHYGDASYAVGYAVGDSPLGPFEKVGGPFLRTGGDVAGPGGQGIITDANGQTWMYYHAWTRGQIGYRRGGARSLPLDPLWWEQGAPVMLGASTAPQTAPATLALAAD